MNNRYAAVGALVAIVAVSSCAAGVSREGVQRARAALDALERQVREQLHAVSGAPVSASEKRASATTIVPSEPWNTSGAPSAGPLVTALAGAGLGAAAGGLIGSAVRHPGAGAAIGAALGLGAGAVIGDQLQGRENQAYEQDQQIYRNQQEINRQREQLEQIRRRGNEYY